MAQQQYADGPKTTRRGWKKVAKSGREYVSMEVIDLHEIENELGTHIVSVKMMKSVFDDASEDDRVFFFNPSEARFLKRKENRQGAPAQRQQQRSEHNDTQF